MDDQFLIPSGNLWANNPNLAYLLKSELMKIIKKKSQVHVVIIIYFQFSEPLTTIIALKVFHRVGNIDTIFIIIAFFSA